jgi:TrkA-N domain/RyR domain
MMSWRSFARRYANYHWWVLGAAGVAAFALGWIGFWEVLDHPSPSDAAYDSLQLFTLDASADRTRIPIPLDIARFLAPFVAGYAGLAAFAAVFRDRVQQMRIPLMRDHVVVCGLGYVGTVFLRHLREAGTRAVVIESDPSNPHIELCRSLGIPLIVGDARLQRTLQAGGVERATRLLALTSDDAVNAEIVAVARELVRDHSRGELRCLAHISDPQVCRLLRIQEIRRPKGAPSSLDFFNTDEISARLLLEEYPAATGDQQPHILVGELDALNLWVVVRAAREWYDRRGDDTSPLLVTVVDNDAEQRTRALLGEYPILERVCRFVSASATIRDIRGLPAKHSHANVSPLTRAYVSAYADEQALQTALTLRHEMDSDIPLVVALSRADGVTRLINEARNAGALTNIEVFPTLERACTVELIKGGSFEAIATAIHGRWRAEQLAEGKPAPSWSELDESRKESSREQARDIVAKLHSIGCEIAPLRDWDAAEFTFAPAEVEVLGVAEHDRWVDERRGSGWTLGEKDPERKKTPYLVPFEELPDDVAEWDRVSVREIPALLASVGIQVFRADTNRSAPAQRHPNPSQS